MNKDDNKTNEKYREELRRLFDKVENNDMLYYFYILCSKLVTE